MQNQSTQSSAPASFVNTAEVPSEEKELVLVQIMNGIAFSAAILMFGVVWTSLMESALLA